MSYIGSWKIDDLLTFYAQTQSFGGGGEIDADSAPTYRVYEDETATPILTGTMALLDSSNTAGFYSEQITLSAANGFDKGKCYCVRITGIVSAVTSSTLRTFQIEAEVDANRVNWANLDNPTTSQALTNTTISPTQVVASVTGDVGGNVGGDVEGDLLGDVAGDVNGNVVGNVNGSVDSVVDPVGTTTADKKAAADVLLARNIAGGSDGGRDVTSALRPLRNRVVIDTLGNLTVYEEDDTTVAWTGVATRTAGANPITEVNPT